MKRMLLLFATWLVLIMSSADALASGAPGMCSPLPATMRAARIHGPGGPEALRIERVPVPVPAAGEVLVRVHYASVNPVDWKLQEAGRLPFPATPGGDFAGEVAATGPDVAGFGCGDLVAGIVNQRVRDGSYAAYVSVPASEIVHKPSAFSIAEAAAYPTVAVAAWRYLVQAAAVQTGDRVLVHGGAGGVGSMAVQIAKASGAYVIATASARNHDYLREIGADEVIDYRAVRFDEVVRDADIVIDTVGGDTLIRSESVLRDGGRLVTLVGSVPVEICAAGRIACPATPPWDVPGALQSVAPLIESGALRINIDRIYPLDEIVDAQQHNRSGSTRGKVVVDMGVDASATTDPDGDSAGVVIPLQAYLDGHATGQEHHFLRAFAPDAILVGLKDGRYTQRPASDYIAQSATGRAPADEALRRRWIRSISVTGHVATAVIELDYPHMKALDHMSLLKFEDGWRIVVKAYEAERRCRSFDFDCFPASPAAQPHSSGERTLPQKRGRSPGGAYQPAMR
jgi:NADPH:quinone reductase-like Zn-dependent oxidoreductase